MKGLLGGHRPHFARLRAKRDTRGGLQPFLPPEQQATGLATTMGTSVAAGASEVHRVIESPYPRRRPVDRVAGLVSDLVHWQLAARELQHLGHERLAVESSIGVEGRQDLFPAAYPYDVACSQGTMHGTSRLRCGHDVVSPLVVLSDAGKSASASWEACSPQ